MQPTLAPAPHGMRNLPVSSLLHQELSELMLSVQEQSADQGMWPGYLLILARLLGPS